MVLFFTCGACAPHPLDDPKPHDEEGTVLISNVDDQQLAGQHHECRESGRVDEVSQSKKALFPASRGLAEDDLRKLCVTSEESGLLNSDAPIDPPLVAQVRPQLRTGPARSAAGCSTAPSSTGENACQSNVAGNNEMRASSMLETGSVEHCVGTVEASPASSPAGTPTRRRKWLTVRMIAIRVCAHICNLLEE